MKHLESFDAWMRNQRLADQPVPDDVLPIMRDEYERAKRDAAAIDVEDVISAPPRAGEYHYAIAIQGTVGLKSAIELLKGSQDRARGPEMIQRYQSILDRLNKK